MGVRILSDHYASLATLYCSTSDWAFGPVFYEQNGHDASDRAEAFCRWLGAREPRSMTDSELSAAYNDWREQEAAQWVAEQAKSDGRTHLASCLFSKGRWFCAADCQYHVIVDVDARP